MRIGLISDTHGSVDPAVHDLLAGVDEILHAGDVTDADVLRELRLIAPVHAVRGNCDWGDTGDLPLFLDRDYGGLTVLVTHIVGRGREHAPSERVLARIEETGAGMVLFGHSHRPDLRRDDERGLLLVNPGSPSEGRGHRRALGVLTLRDGDAPLVEVIGIDGQTLFSTAEG